MFTDLHRGGTFTGEIEVRTYTSEKGNTVTSERTTSSQYSEACSVRTACEVRLCGLVRKALDRAFSCK